MNLLLDGKLMLDCQLAKKSQLYDGICRNRLEACIDDIKLGNGTAEEAGHFTARRYRMHEGLSVEAFEEFRKGLPVGVTKAKRAFGKVADLKTPQSLQT